jgi:hypothetical protein
MHKEHGVLARAVVCVMYLRAIQPHESRLGRGRRRGGLRKKKINAAALTAFSNLPISLFISCGE